MSQNHFEESPFIFRSEDTRISNLVCFFLQYEVMEHKDVMIFVFQNFGARNLTTAAGMGALGSTWDSHFSDTGELGTKSFVINTKLVKSGKKMNRKLLEDHFRQAGPLNRMPACQHA